MRRAAVAESADYATAARQMYTRGSVMCDTAYELSIGTKIGDFE